MPLEAVMSNAQWELVYARIAELVEPASSTTLVFVNTRRMTERAARHLGELLGKQHVAARTTARSPRNCGWTRSRSSSAAN
ncbi:MAG: hypothetical protein U1F20_04170 [Lysobacterales bacterium]